MNDEHRQLAKLSPDDQRLLDALVECGFEPDALALDRHQRRRAEAIMNLLGLVDDYPVEDADASLVDATLARIERHERESAARLRFEPGEARRRRIRLPDFISVAAVLLIGASIVLPVLSYMRQRSIDASCSNNMRMLNYAFGNYAADYAGDVPVAQAGLHSAWTRGLQNTINLGPLVAGGYCEHGHLDCPGHTGPGESYSYQWQSTGERPRWGLGRVTLLLGDRNPVLDAFRSGTTLVPLALSMNHSGRGQNVLSSDGATWWLERSVIGASDNIWMPERGLHDGVSAEPGDVFLVH